MNEDILKVEAEREEIVSLSSMMERCLKERKFNEFEKNILQMLEGHNKLEENQIKEKELLQKIKKLKTEIA